MMIGVKVLRPLMFKAARHEAGKIISCSPLDAAELAASGRAELVNPADAGRLNAAVIEERDKMLRALDKSDRASAGWMRHRR